VGFAVHRARHISALSAEEFEYPMLEKPHNFRFIGSVSPEPVNAEPLAWFDKLHPSKPLIFVSQSLKEELPIPISVNS
jgi:hypothetical protein